ncbi:MAG TPA: DNA mismatch repair protein MutS, partial [Candidatus Polarisedimenticolaceae bacterium]|nr:DNA mismatch repair protein MutS [Candidatus Polarisedimenticolaceae bacterium]
LQRPALRARARERLAGLHDVERLVGRIVGGTAGPRELVGLRAALERLPDLRLELSELEAPLLRSTLAAIDPCADVAAHLARALVDEPPVSLKEGGCIRDGFHAELDEIRGLLREGRGYIASLEAREREATGIASLKVRYNKVFGYYLEVSKANLALVPAHYVRKQTIAGGERYLTPELQERETQVLHAQERSEGLESELFVALRAEIAGQASRLKRVAAALAQLDVLAALAETAAVGGYRRPRIDAGPRLRIASGRHPVVEANLAEHRFVPNDTLLEAGGRALAVLTGPNMGGKSTYLRQVALIVLLAQAGSFVPVDEAEIGIVDRIFCRVGAADSLAEGQSTFMVEMAETAHILHQATPRSLILLDEIGRGTSTFDGLSIAWAVAEALVAQPGGAPRTLFATHYHELTELAVELPGVVNLRMAVREHGDAVVFLHRVEAGAADRSYGIHVARLAGVPRPVVARAREILANLERDEYGQDGLPRRAGSRGPRPGAAVPQPALRGLFAGGDGADPADGAAATILAELRRQDPERITPLEALGLLSSWKRRLLEPEEPK